MPLVPYDAAHKPTARMRFLDYTKGAYIQLLGGPELHVKLYLHMLGHRSVPCQGEECTNCDLPAFPYGYGAALLYGRSGVRFFPLHSVILPVTSEGLDLLIDDHASEIIYIRRQPANKHGATAFDVAENVGPSDRKPFNVLACLESMWRMLDQKDKHAILPIDTRESMIEALKMNAKKNEQSA